MMDDLEWLKSKLVRLDVMARMNADVSSYWSFRTVQEKTGLYETLQVQSMNMYGHADSLGRQILVLNDGKVHFYE